MPYRSSQQPYLQGEDYARWIATRFIPKRFRGRTALEKLIYKGDRVALAKLEVRLGLADRSAVTAAYEAEAKTWVENAEASHKLQHMGKPWPLPIEKIQRIAQAPKKLPLIIGMVARKEEGTPTYVVPPNVVDLIERKQHLRQLLKKTAPEYEPAYMRLARQRLDNALRRTWIRRTRRHHTRLVEIVPPGYEKAESENYGFWPARGIYPERASEHRWFISSKILSPETRELQMRNREHIYLTPEKRVRSGRGSALVTEVLKKGSRGLPRWIKQG